MVLFLRHDSDIIPVFLELHERDDILLHKLRAYRAANQVWQFSGAKGDVLLDLHTAEFIAASLGLYRDDIVGAALVDSHVNFVGFDLSHFLYGSPEVVLQRVAGNPQENIDQTVVANPSQQRLLVAERIFRDYTRCRVRDLCDG